MCVCVCVLEGGERGEIGGERERERGGERPQSQIIRNDLGCCISDNNIIKVRARRGCLYLSSKHLMQFVVV